MLVLQPAEEAVFALFAPYQTEWERQGLKVEEIRQLYGQSRRFGVLPKNLPGTRCVEIVGS